MEQPKYQWSKMSPDRSEQVVIRSDDWKDIEEGKKLANAILPISVKEAEDKDPWDVVEEPQQSVPMCKVHHTPMKLREGKFGKFWSCGTKVGNGWCNYKPPKKNFDDSNFDSTIKDDWGNK